MQSKEWLKLPADELLEAFGAGSHKPGSGSAVAGQVMLSVKLMKTVIKLTRDPKRSKWYQEGLAELQRIESVIDRIYPRLRELFQLDSDQWGKVIELREARDAETNRMRRRELAKQALQAQIPATETLIEIAELCVQVAGMALIVFDKGYKSASGDSAVAVHSAIGALGGCIPIIDLNLLSFDGDGWTENVRRKTQNLRLEYDKLLSEAEERRESLKVKVDRHTAFKKELRELLSRARESTNLSNAEIEKIVRDFQNLLWLYRDRIWIKNKPESPLEVLKPAEALRLFDYEYYEAVSLGEYEIEGELVEIAGVIDNQDNSVTISRKFSRETQRFTAAHELGHCLMHRNSQFTLHRDRALDGSVSGRTRDKREQQADRFAACFLMPSRHLSLLFQERFRSDQFVLNEHTAFALSPRHSSEIRAQCKDSRTLARILASAEYYNGTVFKSLASTYGVSVEAMAIRLEELGLVTM